MSTGSMGPHNLDGPMDPFDLLDLFVLPSAISGNAGGACLSAEA